MDKKGKEVIKVKNEYLGREREIEIGLRNAITNSS